MQFPWNWDALICTLVIWAVVLWVLLFLATRHHGRLLEPEDEKDEQQR